MIAFRFLWAVLSLALSASAAVSTRSSYPLPVLGWTAPLVDVLANFSQQGAPQTLLALSKLQPNFTSGTPDEQSLRPLAPLIEILMLDERSDTPDKFKNLSYLDKADLVKDASELASSVIKERSNLLLGSAGKAMGIKGNLERNQALSLYDLASSLREFSRNYEAYMPPDEYALITQAASQTSKRWHEVHRHLLSDRAQAMAGEISSGAVDISKEPVALRVTAQARKNLEKLKASKNNWQVKDLESILNGYGFESPHRHGSHKSYKHPQFPQITLTLAIHTGEVDAGFVKDVITAIGQLETLVAEAITPSDGSIAEDLPLPPAELFTVRKVGPQAIDLPPMSLTKAMPLKVKKSRRSPSIESLQDSPTSRE